MSFFEPPPPPPEPPPALQRQPEWLGPPDNVVGGTVALELVVGRSDKAAVTIDSASAYPTGVEFALDVRWRPEYLHLVERGAPWHHDPRRGGELPDELFRAGFEFADGSKATSLGAGRLPSPFPADETPAGPLLVARGGGGGGTRWTQRLWLWPLPPEGPLGFVCEWPALGIALTRVDIDVTRIHEAAARTRTLWEDDRRPSGGPSPTPIAPGP